MWNSLNSFNFWYHLSEFYSFFLYLLGILYCIHVQILHFMGTLIQTAMCFKCQIPLVADRKIPDFCVIILYPSALLYHIMKLMLMLCFGQCFGIFYIDDQFTSLFLLCIFFTFLLLAYSLTRTYSLVLKSSNEKGHLWLVAYLPGIGLSPTT